MRKITSGLMLWNRGHWEPIGEARASYRAGELKFRLHGQRLRGLWTLVRMGGASSEGGKNWLLSKDRDDAAGGDEPTEHVLESVTTGRSMDAIRRQSDRVWGPRGETPEPPAECAV